MLKYDAEFLAVLCNLNKIFFYHLWFCSCVFFQAAVVVMNLGAVLRDVERNYDD